MPNPYSELRFINPRWCMGGVWVHSPGGRNDPAGSLGPDPLTISAADFAALLSRRRQIKALLLDQTVLAGMGNIYCDEALFAASIHPRAIAGTLSPARRHRLWSAMRDRLAEAIRRGGSSIRDYRDANDQAGWFQLSLAAYGRTGEPCPACATPIAHCTAAGRSTHFCPRCQVLAGPVKARVKRPFDVPGVKTKVRTADILAAVREVRSRATRRSR